MDHGEEVEKRDHGEEVEKQMSESESTRDLKNSPIVLVDNLTSR